MALATLALSNRVLDADVVHDGSASCTGCAANQRSRHTADEPADDSAASG